MLNAALNAATSLVTVKHFPKSVIEAAATSVPAGRKEKANVLWVKNQLGAH